MPRPIKWRKVCDLPENDTFGPLNAVLHEKNCIQMTIDEYETIRLIDLEGFTQAQCAESMNVARTTIQGIYLEARKKIAQSLVKGKVLSIKGGEYKLCEGTLACGCCCCKKNIKAEDEKNNS